ncbi:MAG: isochorismatase family protein [Nitrospiraceae bacterium]|nr:isochorismatase family protein [Nitrospiraceae bacterium]
MMLVDASFFTNCALLSVDFQAGERGAPATAESLPPDWVAMGFTADDVNAATAFAWDTALPNAMRVVEACRTARLPRLFMHWGYRFEDGMDLDPPIRAMMMREYGSDFTKWHGHIGQPGSRPPDCFNVQPDEYVIAKTAQDAFVSSNAGFVLANLGIGNLILIGGHTEACHGKTARAAKRRGFKTLCVTDATTNARESTRMQGIRDAEFDYTVTTDELLRLLA